MSQSFAIKLRAARESTADPERPGKTLTQSRTASILGIHIVSYRFYEAGRRLPHRIILNEIFRLFPSIEARESVTD